MTNEFEIVKQALLNHINRECHQCHGSGVVTVKHGTVFCTDSDDEIALAYHRDACPTCAKERAEALAAVERLERQSDTERLDWLERTVWNGDVALFTSTVRHGIGLTYRDEGTHSLETFGSNGREAIDAAIESTKESANG